MLVTDLDALLDYQKSAPLCDGNHEWVVDEEHPDDPPHCAKCFVIKEPNANE
jgi:hypothetical protein